MISIKTDFYPNLIKISRSGDEKALMDIYIDELTKVILKNKKELLSILDKYSIPVKDKKKSSSIAYSIATYLPKSEHLQVGVSYLIAKQNRIMQGIAKSKARSQKVGNDTVSKIRGIFTPINLELQNDERMNGFRNAFITKIKKLSGENEQEKKSGVDGKVEDGGSNMKYVWWGLGAIGVGAAIYFGYRLYKDGKSPMNIEDVSQINV